MENNNNEYKKMYKNKDFITTTDFLLINILQINKLCLCIMQC